ncbi:MAG: hypothetical protein ABL921_04790 [Pirellula sp.]
MICTTFNSMSIRKPFQAAKVLIVMTIIAMPGGARSDDDFEHPPISYMSSPSQDPVAKLMARVQKGDVTLAPDSSGSHLKALLHALGVPESSQCLVFSKTSLQISHIGPRTPRAIYFNDSVYVGSVQGSHILELTAVDPQLGCVFYTLEREDDRSFQIIRDRGQCLTCHATTRTERVPGVLVRSIYSDKSGRPRSGSSTYITDHRSPFEHRWGGWYVTGHHGTMRHLGNLFATDRDDPQKVDMEQGANMSHVPELINTENYLQPTSDIVALMVMEHQTRVHNLITRANYEARQAAHLDASMNEALERDPSYVSDSTRRRIASVGDALVAGLLFSDECPLQGKIEGSSNFAKEFSARGPRDRLNRSLYQLDLETRMFRFPLSYLILSDHFDGLPKPVMDYVRNRMKSILENNVEVPTGVRLSDRDRSNLVDMLRQLKPGWLDHPKNGGG